MTQHDIPSRADDLDPLFFTPVPLARQRRNGWTATAQVCFIRALARLGSVTAAARSVGRTRRGAYTLRDRPGGESFAAAWDRAMQIALSNAADQAIHAFQAMDRGEPIEKVPVFSRRTGSVSAWRAPHPDHIAIRALNAIDFRVNEATMPLSERLSATNRRRHLDRLERELMAEYVAQRAERERAAAEAEARARAERAAESRLTPEQQRAVREAWDCYVAGRPQPKPPRARPRVRIA